MTKYKGRCKVLIPEGRSGDVAVERFEVREDMGMLRMMMFRSTEPGEYTKITRNGHLWMSDTRAEYLDAARFIGTAKALGGRVLVNGLGLGMVVGCLLECPDIEHIDVVEIDDDVINLVAPSFEDGRVTIHHADAYEMKWPRGTCWQSAWHDIWDNMCTDDLRGHARLNRKYGGRVEYQECWAHDLLLEHRRREQGYERMWER